MIGVKSEREKAQMPRKRLRIAEFKFKVTLDARSPSRPAELNLRKATARREKIPAGYTIANITTI